MKSLKSYFVIAILILSTVLVPNAFANAVTPVKGIDVVVLKCCPSSRESRQHVSVSADGMINLQLTEPNTYTIKYADGPLKGQVIKTVKTTKAQSISCKIDKAYLKTNAKGNSQ